MLDLRQNWEHGDHCTVDGLLEDEGLSLSQAALLTGLSPRHDLVELYLGYHAIELVQHHTLAPVLIVELLLELVIRFHVLGGILIARR